MYVSIALWFALLLSQRVFVLIAAGFGPTTWVDVVAAVLADSGLALLSSWLVPRPALRVRVGIYTVLGIFLVFTFGFARIYERTFTLSYIRTDSLSIWKENFVSAFYELGFSHLLLAVVLSGLFYAIEKWQVKAPAREIRWQWVGGLVLITAAWFFTPAIPALISNPVVAAISRPPVHKARVTESVSDNDLVPQLDSPDKGPLVRPVEIQRGQKKNIILYFLESTPASVIGRKIAGKEITPNLNRLKEHSLYFTRHYANFPLSINAFYNAFCGAYALPDGAWISLVLPDFKVQCLSEILKKQQYRTIALHAGYLGYAKQKRFMQNRGFDLMIDAEKIKKPPYDKGMGPWGAADERSMIRPLTEFAGATKEQPFLAVLFAFAPHHPYNMPDDYPPLFERDEGLRRGERKFLNSLHFADFAFGEILSALEKNGVLKDSILIAFGDHGEAFYEHRGNYNHPFFIYEENIHVPLFIYVEGARPQIIDRVTSHVDILPTVLDYLGLDKDLTPLHAGRSMLKGSGQTLAHIQAFWNEEYSGVVDHRYKFIRKETGARELFDLSSDPGESKNLSERQAELAEAYAALTEKAFAQKRAYYKTYGNYELTRFKPSSQDK